MKINLRRILFTFCLVAILVGIAVFCLIVGRGHTVYLDNLTSGSYSAYNQVDVYYDGAKLATLNADERTSLTLTGQKLELKLKAKKTESSTSETLEEVIELPYSLDGIVINLPAYLEGASEEVYLSEYVSQVKDEDLGDDEVPVTDEFGMTTDEE